LNAAEVRTWFLNGANDDTTTERERQASATLLASRATRRGQAPSPRHQLDLERALQKVVPKRRKLIFNCSARVWLLRNRHDDQSIRGSVLKGDLRGWHTSQRVNNAAIGGGQLGEDGDAALAPLFDTESPDARLSLCRFRTVVPARI